MNTQYDVKIACAISLLAIWVIVSAGGCAWSSPSVSILALSLLGAVVVAAITQPFRFAGFVAAVIASALYTIAQIAVLGLNSSSFIATGIGLLSFAGVSGLGFLITRWNGDIVRQLDQAHKLTDELRVFDPITQMVRFRYLRQSLDTEVARSRRYSKELCLILAQIANWDELIREQDEQAALQLRTVVAEVFKNSFRNVDATFSDTHRLGAILPETDPAGARIVCQRLAENIARRARVAIHCGVVHYPSDAVSTEELIRASEAALHLALSTGQPLVFYVQIRTTLSAPTIAPAVAAEFGEIASAEVILQPAPTAPGGARATIVKIRGIVNFSETLNIERALANLTGVRRACIVEYSAGMLTLSIEHTQAQLLAELPRALTLPIRSIHQERDTIQVELESANVGT